jgi:cytochrome c oxidase subunit 1
MTDATVKIDTAPPENLRANMIKLTMGLGGVVFLLMMIFGLVMRTAQGGIIDLDPAIFYQLLTAHGAGMVGSAALSGAAILWYFVARYVDLNPKVYLIFLGLFLAGVVCILGSIFFGQYGGAWTFLFPLPAISGGAWEAGAAVVFCVGYLLIGVGFLIYYLEMGYKVSKSFKGLFGGLGWKFIINGDTAAAPPPTIIAASSVMVFNSIGIVFGAIVLVANIVNLLIPSFAVDALLAKNATYFFGHVFINATIYMAVTAVYEIIPEYTGKPWKSTRLFAIAWAAVVVFVQAVYFHHLLQDVNMPAWAMATGQVVSYASGVPLIAVTLFSTALYIKGSGMKWDLATKLLVLGVGGWGVGAIPAMIDGMVSVNKLMHNTQWVPGHFHTYLLLGEAAMAFGFAAWLVKDTSRVTQSGLDRFAFLAYVAGGAGFVLMFLWSGASSIPRRWAVHYEAWQLQSQVATVFAAVVILVTTLFIVGYVKGLMRRGAKT